MHQIDLSVSSKILDVLEARARQFGPRAAIFEEVIYLVNQADPGRHETGDIAETLFALVDDGSVIVREDSNGDKYYALP